MSKINFRFRRTLGLPKENGRLTYLCLRRYHNHWKKVSYSNTPITKRFNRSTIFKHNR